MNNRRRLARERLEIFLVYLILAYRRLIMIGGLLLLGCALAVMTLRSPVWIASLLFALTMFLLGTSFDAVLYTARFGAWIATLWRSDEG